ncbi:type VI secretion system protein TssA [Aureliella helgolandensis]|uniref:ImpA N-terminal domain-containing protein n=1 Tax=Aureliella helgolandensis TaxID=2527968 RepID=A0A518G534_9BACT|nr:type VI secretion system protein TssA [Aureliella helgolandensis]QDV23706.1 hypothetical protein Q31a_20110 [Aureliella helgolandensis]
MTESSQLIRFNIEDLLLPISESSPSGDPHIYSRELREPLLNLRRPEVPSGDADMSFRRTPDWQAIVDTAQTALATRTKDIRLVCHIIEAETRLNGFAGLSTSLEILTELLSECWDRCNPPLEENDVDSRISPMENMLDDSSRGICFPITVRQLPLLGAGDQSICFLDFQSALSSNEAEKQATLEAAATASTYETLKQRSEEIQAALQRLQELKTTLEAKIGEQAPGFTYLRTALEDCNSVVSRYLAKTEPAPVPMEASDSPSVDGLTDSTDLASVNGTSGFGAAIAVAELGTETHTVYRLRTRDDAYRLLSEASTFLQSLEPHSPIPYMVNRAVDLGQLSFPNLVTKLVREESILNELRREFGIPEACLEQNETAN